MKHVLDVGSSNVKLDAARFDGWQVATFDMDEEASPDYLGNVLYIERVLWPLSFDAVYASHILEHLHPWETVSVLRQFGKLLAPDGWLEVWVPDVFEAFTWALEHNMGLADALYMAPNGSNITLLDILYGWGREVKGGKGCFMHRMAFDWKVLRQCIEEAGYPSYKPLDRGRAFECGYAAWFGQTPEWLR